jgi:hypothetical protein
MRFHAHCTVATTLMLGALLAQCPIASVAAAKDGELLFEAKADETIRVRTAGTGNEDKHSVVEQQKVAFHPVTLWGHDKNTPDRHVIAKETLRQLLDDAREGVESSLRVDLFFANDSTGKFPSQPTHSIDVPNAHEAHFEDNYWTATTLGCCDAEPYTRMYAYGGDRPFLRYNEEGFWKIEVPNAHGLDRYVGMVIRSQVPNDAAQESIFGKQKNAVAAIGLAAAGKPLDMLYLVPKAGVDADKFSMHSERLVLRGTGPKDEQQVRERFVTLWSLNGAEKSTAGATAVRGVAGEAGVYVDDESTETLRFEINEDKFAKLQFDGTKLKVVGLSGAPVE